MFSAMRVKLRCTFPYRARTLHVTPERKGVSVVLMTVQFVAVLVLLSPLSELHGQKAKPAAYGVAWRVIGGWQVQGVRSEVENGSALAPGSLLVPEGGSRDHSITVLLPDGQRVLYECFSAKDCERGFRVPSLYRQPTELGANLLARVNAVFQRKSADVDTQSADEVPLPRDEAIATLRSDHKVSVGGLAAALSNGQYSYVARPVSRGGEKPIHGDFQKNSRSVTLNLPSQGLFDVTISDQMKRPRIDLLLGAVEGPKADSEVKLFQQAVALLKDWNEDYQGWPIHEFRRAYLRSLLLGIRPESAVHAGSRGVSDPQAAGEPKFTPAPGVFKGDTEVTLKCGTPGATIRYTVDGSQPLDGSTVYRAPIIVKGTALMIKAFASAPGKKDSPVVTGIFRIGE